MAELDLRQRPDYRIINGRIVYDCWRCERDGWHMGPCETRPPAKDPLLLYVPPPGPHVP